jgi:hypothetical protein
MKAALLLVGLVFVGAAGLLGGSSARADVAASRIVDRTLLCAPALSGGLRQVEARAHAGIREGRSSWKQLPFAVLATGSVGSRLTRLENALGWVTAGTPSGTTTMDYDFNLAWPHTDGTVALNRRRCRTSSANVPLTVGRLSGGRAGVFGDAYKCAAPRRVLVRVRAVFSSASGLHGDSLFLRTNTPLESAQLAMRSEAGRPLVYADVLDAGRARLFTASSCFPK